ncbi:peptidase T [Treponema sp. Marseille-Q4132]|uniref:peptidase T n=1 Tax=Treponema sp. Marseille-Q4132 TaxID=2766701 RepID=UPI001653409A|nr:peptidase T [Treponema sp. Marseille-Q4132]QNL96745.1 peptidase T [Treponema sp. Marseille-Q4132]
MNYIKKNSQEEKELLERFLRYVKTYSESDSNKADEGIMPSTPQQRDFANMIAEEMKAAGLENVHVTEFCYAYGVLPASEGFENVPPFCLLSHMDTVDEVTGKNVNPVVHENYDGALIELAETNPLDAASDEALAQAARERDTIITTDGHTLLGADDKAGIAAIMTAISYLKAHEEIKHGKIEVIFSPDEETGHGMDKVPLESIQSKRAYTVDGGHIGELETECFNAVGTTIVFTGKSTHTGTARKAGMINSIAMASHFVSSLPITERPETSDGMAGFYAPIEFTGTIEKSTVYLLLRDFDGENMKKRQKTVEALAEAAALSFGGNAKVTHKTQYFNMKQKLDEHPEVVRDLKAAYRKAGVEPVFIPIRGGTDGSRLTEMGIPTPNIFTGGHNYHSRMEWASLNQMCKAADILINLAGIIGTAN